MMSLVKFNEIISEELNLVKGKIILSREIYYCPLLLTDVLNVMYYRPYTWFSTLDMPIQHLVTEVQLTYDDYMKNQHV